MTIIYATQADQKQAETIASSIEDSTSIVSPHGFKGVNHNAKAVVIVGRHNKVEKAYKGIMPIEVIESEKDEPEPKEPE